LCILSTVYHAACFVKPYLFVLQYQIPGELVSKINKTLQMHKDGQDQQDAATSSTGAGLKS